MATNELDKITDRIRRLVELELTSLEAVGGLIGLGEDGLKRLTQCALILQRIRQPFSVSSEGKIIGYSDKQLMEKAGVIDE